MPHGVPVGICGELASQPLEAMALIGLGYRALSMSPMSIGPVKLMVMNLDAARVTALMDEALAAESGGCPRPAGSICRAK